MTDQSYAAAASKSCTLPTFKSHTDYCSQFGYTHEDDRKATEMVRQQIDQLGVMWTEFARHFDDRAPDAVTRQAFGDFYQRVDWLEAVATNLLPGITFTTYATIRATFVAARCQGAEAFRCLTRPSTATTPPISPQQRRSISG